MLTHEVIGSQNGGQTAEEENENGLHLELLALAGLEGVRSDCNEHLDVFGENSLS